MRLCFKKLKPRTVDISDKKGRFTNFKRYTEVMKICFCQQVKTEVASKRKNNEAFLPLSANVNRRLQFWQMCPSRLILYTHLWHIFYKPLSNIHDGLLIRCIHKQKTHVQSRNRRITYVFPSSKKWPKLHSALQNVLC